MRSGLQNYRADWVEGLWVWEEQEPASWYLEAKGKLPLLVGNINKSPKVYIRCPSV